MTGEIQDSLASLAPTELKPADKRPLKPCANSFKGLLIVYRSLIVCCRLFTGIFARVQQVFLLRTA